jgi:uncharacterized protein (TIGR00645 family)
MRMPKNTFEHILFACRWLLTPFYVALVVALIALLIKVVLRAYGMIQGLATLSEEDVILGALGVIDLTLTASLIVLVVFSTYSNFVSRVDTDAHRDWPTWMIGIDFGELKLKLIASIVAISSIKLLEAYMNIDHETKRQLVWQTGIFGAFVGAALLLGISDAVGRAYGEHE